MFTFSQQKGTSALLTGCFVLSFLLLTGCASNQIDEESAESVEIETVESDPFEGVNRKIFVFNEVVDDYLAAPISDAYLWVTPQFVQTGIGNFFNNLKDINVVLNDVMQGKVGQGAEDSGRFAINSTIGLLGLFDVATDLGFEKHEEDFAQTLAVWGVPQGPYLVLPVLGPITTRGVPGSVFDAAANPATYVGLPIQVLQMLNARANAEGALNFIDEAALDPYVFTRESFLQHRKHLITDGNSELTDDVLDLEDDFYEDEEDDEGTVEQIGTATEVESTTDEATEVSKVEATEAEPTTALVDSEEAKTDSSGYKLKLTTNSDESTAPAAANDGDFDNAASSFDGAVKSFDNATRSFEEANYKLNHIKK